MTAEVYKAIYVSAISLGCLTVLTLLASKKGEKRIDIAISILIINLMMSPLNAYTTLIFDKPIALLLALSQTVTWVYGPIMFLILQYIQLNKVKVHIACLHFVPFVLAVTELQTGLLHSIFPQAFLTLFFLQISSYCVYCFITIFRQKKRFLRILREYKSGTYYWLSYLIFGLIALTAWDAIIVSFYISRGIMNTQVLGLIASGVGLAICVIAFLIVYQPRESLSAGEFLSDSNESESGHGRNKGTNKISKQVASEERVKLRYIELTPTMVDELSNKLEILMNSHQLYLDDEISLAKIAALLGVNRNQLSELFNVHMETSFYDYINDYRYREAIKLLSDTQCDFTVSDVAYRSGFNNRNSFYRVFKQKLGVTPTEYRKQHLKAVHG